MIRRLNPIIRGWTNYHRHVCSKSTFSKLNHDIWKALWLWCRRRHKRQKSNQWIKDKYFVRFNGVDWCFRCEEKDENGVDTIGIVDAANVKIERHVKVKSNLNPYDA